MFSLPFSTERTVEIDAPAERVFDFLGDFENWPTWSPWLIQERECTYRAEKLAGRPGHFQAWEGQRIGSGKMKLIEAKRHELLSYELNFLKPWKSRSQVQFELEDKLQSTRVTWKMQGTVPVFLFFMRKMMSAWVGNDYDRGLSMLKDQLENGHIHSQVEVAGDVHRDGFFYYGIRRTCKISEIGPMMTHDFEEIAQLSEQQKLAHPDWVVSLYHKFDLVRGECEYTSGFAYKNPVEFKRKPKQYDTGKIGSHLAIRVDHQGAYKHLGNAWSTAMSVQRAEKKKLSKKIPMYEIYTNDPKDTKDADLRTEVYLPLQ